MRERSKGGLGIGAPAAGAAAGGGGCPACLLTAMSHHSEFIPSLLTPSPASPRPISAAHKRQRPGPCTAARRANRAST